MAAIARRKLAHGMGQVLSSARRQENTTEMSETVKIEAQAIQNRGSLMSALRCSSVELRFILQWLCVPACMTRENGMMISHKWRHRPGAAYEHRRLVK